MLNVFYFDIVIFGIDWKGLNKVVYNFNSFFYFVLLSLINNNMGELNV